ncbi:5762_t:CDS:2, partial [Funneliformis geosporum]
YPATRTRARAAQETPYDQNKIDIEKKEDDVELIQHKSEKRATALYCDAYIKNMKILLIIDSGSAGYIISLKLLKDLDIEITEASKTIMTRDPF